MNVVIITDSGFIAGGVEKTAVTSAIALAKNGHRVALFCGHGPLDPLLEQHPEVQGVCLGQPLFFEDPSRRSALKRIFWNHEAAARLKELLATFPVGETVVHVHDVHRVLSAAIFEEVIGAGYPLVMSLHNYAVACPNSVFYDYQKETVCPLKPLSLQCIATQCTHRGFATKAGHLVRTLIQKHRAGIPARIKNFIVVSNFSKSKLAPYLPEDANFDIVPYPVDRTDAPAVEVAANRSFVYVGRLVAEKNPVLLAEAAKMADVPVTFVGDGMMADAVRAANPEARITGWVRPEQVQEELSQARALCMVSRWYEGMPLVVTDAMARGLPIVVSDACASQEAIEDGVSGLLFRSGEVADLATKLLRLQDDATVSAMGKAAYAKSHAEPQTLEVHVGKLERIYERMLKA